MIVGIDAHAKTCTVCEMSAKGKVVDNYEIPTTYTGLAELLRRTPKSTEAVLESSTSAKPIYRYLEKNGWKVHMANPRGVKALSPTSKNDEKDAEMLAHLLRTDLLPKSYVPSAEEEEIRTIARLRQDIGQKAVETKNQIHAILKSNLVGYDRSDLFGKGGLEYLSHVELPQASKLALDSYLRQLGQLKEEIAIIDRELAVKADANPQAKLLMSMPGIDYYSALVILGEIGDINRFPSPTHLASYAGLVPRVKQSGDIERIGRITKGGPSRLRWILTNNAHVAIRYEGKLRRFYTRLAKKKGTQKAIVAVAHKMLIVIYHMLTKSRPYEERNDELFERKIDRLETKAMRVKSTMKKASDALAIAGMESLTTDSQTTTGIENELSHPRGRHGQATRVRSNEKDDALHSHSHKANRKKVKAEVEDIGK